MVLHAGSHRLSPEHGTIVLASGSLTQSGFGIKPYTGFLGALRVRDAVDVDIDMDLASADGSVRTGQ